jgi:signal transduction histidine kinase
VVAPDDSRQRSIFPTAVTVAKALVVARWLTLAWMVGIVAVSSERDAIRHPLAAWLCVLAVALAAGWSTAIVRTDPSRVFGTPFLVVEAALAVGLSVIDGWVFEPGHVFEVSQSLATQYPLIAVVSIGLARGPIIAGAVGLLIGPAEWLGAVLNGFDEWSMRHVVSLVATSLFYAAAGAVFGWQARLLRSAEADIADRRARDDVARVLHDTVLQTLAMVEHRTAGSDPDLANAARVTDRELRQFLFGSSSLPGDSLERRVRRAVERAERHHPLPVGRALSVSVIDDGCRAPVEAQEAIAGATGEAVANALQHAGPTSVIVFVETLDDGSVYASVRDDGCGFDATTIGESSSASLGDRHGVADSIVGRMRDVGGRSAIASAPGRGTEVQLWTT